ncbi:MAG: D-aminoacyl-tRNA deacylase [Sulfolobales archaeon]
MMIGFAYSVQDPAGRGIAESLSRRLRISCSSVEDLKASIVCDSRIRVIGFIDDVTSFEYLDQYFPETDLIAILSRHRSESEIPSLTVHYTGNPRRSNLYGGNPMELSYTRPSISNAFLRNIKDVAMERGLDRDYEISFEATHHGPTTNRKPLVFLEIGSTEDQWKDPVLHDAWVEAIARTLSGLRVNCNGVAIGVGGTHYSERFTRLSIEEGVCMSHIIPRYALKELSEEDLILIVDQAIRKTLEKVELLVVERKSLSSSHIRSLEEKFSREGIEVRRI